MTIEQRVERLERENRRLKRELLALPVIGAAVVLVGALVGGAPVALGILLAGGACIVLWGAVDRHVPDVIRAKKFEVIGEDGQTLVEMGETVNAQGEVATYDVKGQYLASLGSAYRSVRSQPLHTDREVEIGKREETESPNGGEHKMPPLKTTGAQQGQHGAVVSLSGARHVRGMSL